MKKSLSFALSLGMILSMSAAMGVTASAAPIDTIGGSQSQGIKGSYTAGTKATVYNVDVAWGSMEFTYTAASNGTWNPSTHTYANSTSAKWSCADGANKITVTNHSNESVVAQLSFAADSAHSDITVGFYQDAAFTQTLAGVSNELTLETAEAYTANTINGMVTYPAGARTKEAYMKITAGSLSAGTGVALGTVTVTLAENNAG